jgi:hypothetical protein
MTPFQGVAGGETSPAEALGYLETGLETPPPRGLLPFGNGQPARS